MPPGDAATMTATNLDTSAWQIATNGQDVFQGRVGYAWFRASFDGLASTNRPLTLHFGCVDDNATVYLNGILLGQYTSASQAFDIASVGSAGTTMAQTSWLWRCKTPPGRWHCGIGDLGIRRQRSVVRWR